MDSTKRAKRIRLIVFTALMTALTTALTLASVPLASGYYNFGDIPIFMSACLLGPIPALITGALGAMLGDIILGYMAYAPFTLVIKALEGVIAGLLFKVIAKAVKKQVPQSIFYCLGSILGGLEMALGYFLAEGLLLAEDSWTGGVVNLPFNILQGTISAVVATVLLYACQLKRVFEKIYNRAPQVVSSAALDDTTAQNTSSDIEPTQESAQDAKTAENNDDLRF
ncbi:MAG: ECF transporter S component [Clostridia bacterium]|nr:ECF transporter S component [Clostridia bacterium]